VQALEALVPLSGAMGTTGAAVVTAEGRAVHVAQALPLVLTGTIVGKYTVSDGNPDTGATFRLLANGRVSPLGKSGLTALIQTPINVGNFSATGSATLFKPRGSVKMTYVGPIGPSPAPLPATLSYTITGGTGAYRNATGAGSIAVSTAPVTNLTNLVGEMTFIFHGVPVT
jgi:hypothetical protein